MTIIPHGGDVQRGQPHLQARFDTRRIADRIDEKLVRPTIDDDDRAFIERCDMLFLATADGQGRPNCSYKGGAPGFVRVVDDRHIAFPSYDGNGMYLSAGNLLVNPHVGLLFIDFQDRRRLRLNGVASFHDDDPLLAEYPEAQLIIRVRAEQVFPNCPRYIHSTGWSPTRGSSRRRAATTPVPQWKRADWSHDALPLADPARDDEREVVHRG